MTIAAARIDLKAHRDAIRLDDHEIVAQLRELLGARLVAYLGEVKETRAVAQWAADERRPPQLVMTRLRTAYQVAALLNERDAPGVVQAWFQGMNPLLDDVSPARVLREQPLETAGPAVLGAARSFAALG